MKNITELNGNFENKSTLLMDHKGLLIEWTSQEICVSSTVSSIICKLIAESKHGEMLGRLQTKLGRTKEEVYMLVSEL
jgi:hypothetical protein